MSNDEHKSDYPQPFLGVAQHAVEAPHAHVLPKSVYFGVLGALIFLTVLTVATAQIDLGVFNLPLAMVIALTKGSLVAAIFMHLWWDSKFNLLIFVSSLLFLSIFVVVTMLDTSGRDLIEPQRANFLPRDELVDVEPAKMQPGVPFGAVKWEAKHKSFVEKHGDHGGSHQSGHEAGHEAAGDDKAKGEHH